MIESIIKNPVFIAFSASSLTYLFLYYRQKKDKTTKQRDKKRINILIPLLVGIIVWVCALLYFEEANTINRQELIEPNNLIIPTGMEINNIEGGFVKPASEASIKSFQLISKGLSLPKNLEMDLPDAFLETF
jgi:hypothetical protein